VYKNGAIFGPPCIFGQFGGHWAFVMKSGQPVLCALRAVCAGVPSCWKMNPVGSQRLL